MSADNGIYILRTSGKDEKFEYRIMHLQGVENYKWHFCNKHPDGNFDRDENGEHVCKVCTAGYCKHSNCHIKNARRMWSGCEVWAEEEDAWREAYKLEEEILKDDFCPILEYGVSSININRIF